MESLTCRSQYTNMYIYLEHYRPLRLPLHTSGYFLTILYFRLQINIKVLDHHHAGISRTPLRSEYVDPGNRVLSINKLYSKYTEAYSKFINIPKV